MNLYYATVNEQHSGSGSYYYEDKSKAEAARDAKNISATQMGLKTRYTVEEIDSTLVAAKEIRH